MSTTTYDPEADAAYVRLAPAGVRVADTREVEPGIVLDLDAEGRLVGIEVLNVTARVAAGAAGLVKLPAA